MCPGVDCSALFKLQKCEWMNKVHIVGKFYKNLLCSDSAHHVAFQSHHAIPCSCMLLATINLVFPWHISSPKPFKYQKMEGFQKKTTSC